MTFFEHALLGINGTIEDGDAWLLLVGGVDIGVGDKIQSPAAAGDYICLLGDGVDGWTSLGRSGTYKHYKNN